LYAHCQPQVHYLYHDSLSKQLRGQAVCDYLIDNPSNHELLLSKILPHPVPHANKSNRTAQLWSLTKAQVWVWEIFFFFSKEYREGNDFENSTHIYICAFVYVNKISLHHVQFHLHVCFIQPLPFFLFYALSKIYIYNNNNED
jgi:hypothetical protein